MAFRLNKKFVYITGLLLLFAISANAQVGINTEEPAASLDVNGNLRIREAKVSTTTIDDILVIDDAGYVKRSIASNSYFRGYLASDFESGTTVSEIYKVVNFTVVDQPSDEFDVTTSTFTPAFSGLYNIVLTSTVTVMNNLSTSTNIVYGLVDAETNKWVMRFSILTSAVRSAGLNSLSGLTDSFSGAVQLTKGKKYYFGVTDNVRLLSHPSGQSGEGIGSYLAIELIKAN